MTDPALALRATSDALLADISRLADLERAKRHLTPGDAKLVEVSTEIELIADRVLQRTAEERALTEDAHAMVELGVERAPEQSIEQTDPSRPPVPSPATPPVETARSLQLILDEWRDAERRAGEALPGSPPAELARAQSERLKAEYHRAYQAAQAKNTAQAKDVDRPA
jgi:hypothetical protein